MKRLLTIVIALLLLVSAFGCAKPAPAAAAEDTSLKDVLEKGTLLQGMDDAFPPMGFRDENDEIVGFDVDVAREVATPWAWSLYPYPSTGRKRPTSSIPATSMRSGTASPLR
jgi:ABC-type amino acid transport substrate-binding protein